MPPVREHRRRANRVRRKSVGRDKSADSSGPATNATAPIYAQPLCNGGVLCSPSAFAGANANVLRTRTSQNGIEFATRSTSVSQRPPVIWRAQRLSSRAPIRQRFEIEGRGFTEFFSAATDKCASLLLAMLIVTGSGLACSDRPLTFSCPPDRAISPCWSPSDEREARPHRHQQQTRNLAQVDRAPHRAPHSNLACLFQTIAVTA
jgi:hypothetical protein